MENSYMGKTKKSKTSSTRKVLRVGMIGAGGFAVNHARALSMLSQEGVCELVSVCDPYVKNLQEKWDGLSTRDIGLYQDTAHMLSQCSLDYLVIASPPHLHYEHVVQALRGTGFIYLEKPPVPTFAQLKELLVHREIGRVAVGFQMLEAPIVRAFRQQLESGELGRIVGISASGLWPRSTTYYNRAKWAGQMIYAGQPVFDGPLTNALAHIVHLLFYLVGDSRHRFARPETVRGYLGRARPIEGYDFGWLQGRLTNGIDFNIMAGHCSQMAVPWMISVRTDRGVFTLKEEDLPSTALDLLIESHRSAFHAATGKGKPTTALSDCWSYNRTTSAGLLSSGGICDIPQEEIEIIGSGENVVFHVQSIYDLVRGMQAGNLSPANGLRLGAEIDCMEKAPERAICGV